MQRRSSLPRFGGRVLLSLFAATAVLTPAVRAQDETVEEERKLVVEPAALELDVGATTQLAARVVDAQGNALEEELIYFSRARRSVTISDEGLVEGLKPGKFQLVVRTRRRNTTGEGQASRANLGRRLSAVVEVTVNPLPIARVVLDVPPTLYAGTVVPVEATAYDTRDNAQDEAVLQFSSSAPAVASFDAFGALALHGAGKFTATVTCDGQSVERALEVRANPVRSLELTPERDAARTGDVVHFTVVARDAQGDEVLGVPVDLSLIAKPDDDLGEPASGQVAPGDRSHGDWRFVAETPGRYTAVATCGDTVARATVSIEQRDVSAKIQLVGRGLVSDTHTSDLWVWEGVDGRDYAVTGTWGADGEAHFWDVTEPKNIERVATVKVDARTVNDVKVSKDGKLCVLSREGASNRKNGIVLVDVTNPREPRILSEYDEGLTGGVHNVFIDGHHVYALSAGRRYDIVDVSDPLAPRTVGKYELEEPGHSIHDVWVVDGLAYSSNWSNGVHVVDVGNGIKGGSPENPVYVADYAYPSGWNHAAFPYRNEETGRTYVVAGDEAFPYGLNVKDKPTRPRGWLHFIDFTDPENPDEVARYEVPEAGTHNLWIEDDTVYVAYYNGGLRVVDISGELMGDLYRQGREKAFFFPDDPEGHIPNAPMVWGPQPHKGNLFFSDWNSGLWAVRVVEESKE